MTGDDNTKKKAKILAGVLVPLAFVALLSVILFVARQRINKNRKSTNMELVALDKSGSSGPKEINKSNEMGRKTLNVENSRPPALYDIEIQTKLGSGNFGEVFLGNWNGKFM